MRAVNIAIIGAGECGARAAFTLRDEGFAGSILLIGDETEAPYERPPLSKATLLTGDGPRFVVEAAGYAEREIELLTGCRVERIEPADRILRLADGESVSFDKLLLATGVRPRLLPGIDPGSGRIVSLRRFSDAQAIRAMLGHGRTIAILGGGFIGLELAATARSTGAKVIVIETQPRVLMRGVPEELANSIADRHRAEGVDLVCGVSITSITEMAGGVTVALGDGRVVKADHLITGIGAIPNTELAAEAGLAIDNGIKVNERLETTVPGIWAAGDCCSFPLDLYDGRRVRLESWRNAQDQGRLAARNLMGAGASIDAVPWFWSDQYDMTLQVAGLADGATTHVRRSLGPDATILFHLDAEGRLLAASGLSKGNQIARDIRVAEMLIAARARPDPALLSDPNSKLKSLLTARTGE